MDCIFCQIIAGQIPSKLIDQNEQVFCFLSLENHPLVITKKHIKNIYDLDEENGAAAISEVIKIAQAVKKGLDCQGVYITQANEPAGGQDVFHIHFHIYPRWDRSDLALEKMTDKEKDQMVEKIKQSLTSKDDKEILV